MTLGALSLAALLLVEGGGPAAAAESLECLQLWDGVSRPFAPTEVGIRLEGGASAAREVELAAPRVTYCARTPPARAEEPRTLWIPYWPAEGALAVTVRGEGREVGGRVESHRPEDRRVVAVVASTTTVLGERDLPDDVLPVYPPPDLLPRSPGGYDGIDALVIDPVALARLEPDQVGALSDHLGRCGRVLLAGGTDQLLATLAANGGCSSRFVGGTSTGRMGRDLSALLDRTPPPEASPMTLQAFLPASPRGLGPRLSWLLLAYAAALSATVCARRGLWIPLTLPVLGGLSVALVSLFPPRPALVCWSEAWEGTTPVRYSALLRVGGSGLGRTQVVLPDGCRLPKALSPGTPIRFDLGAGAKERKLTIGSPLFASSDFLLKGSSAAPRPLRLRVEASTPVVEGTTEGGSPEAVLAWNRELYAVPPLRAGQRWAPSPQTLKKDGTEIERLVLSRSSEGVPLVLVRHLPEWARALGDAVGWLVISPEPSVRT